MGEGTKLVAKSGGVSCIIMHAPKPPKKWTIEYENGKTAQKSKSFIKKYYNIHK